MSRRRLLVRRVILAVVAAYLVLSVTFAFVALTPNWDLRGMLGSAAFAGANESELAEMERTYLAARGYDRPLHERYVDWLVDVSTLHWGVSYSTGEPVSELVLHRLWRTLSYVVPGVLVAVAGGLAAGIYAAVRQRPHLDGGGRVLAYVAYGLPSFYLAALAMSALGYRVEFGTLAESHPLLAGYVLPAGLLALSLLAGQLRYARAYGREYVTTDFARLVRAKGGDSARIARHALRNAAVPLVSLFFTEMLGVLVLNVYVLEFVFGIDGLGTLTYHAVRASDMPLVLGATMAVAFVGIAGSLVQDVVSIALDPRLDHE